MFKKIAYFLCLIDQTPRIDLANIAFIIILVKIVFAQAVDWISLCAFAATILNSAHARSTVTNSAIKETTDKLQTLQTVVDTIKAKV